MCYVPNVYPCQYDTHIKRYNTLPREEDEGREKCLYKIYISIPDLYIHIWTHLTFDIVHILVDTYTLTHNITCTHTYTYVCTRCNTKYETLAGDPERPRFDEYVCECDIHISLFAILCRKWKRKKNRHLPNTKRIVAR